MNTSPPLRHERRRLQTRNLLIQTMLQLVLEKGYEAISFQDITDRADLGRGTFYIHFKDKEEVVWTAFRDLFQEFEQATHKQLDRQMPQRDVLSSAKAPSSGAADIASLAVNNGYSL
jgi:AcrR family transcriptional regulator